VHITVLCPYCRSVYQVQAKLRGQLVRCPNTVCRKVFSVPDVPETGRSETDGSAPTPPHPRPPLGGSQRSGTVGELVPILPAEQISEPQGSEAASKHVSEILPVAPTTARQPAEANWWQTAPPVRSPAQRGKGGREPESDASTAPSSEPSSEAAWWREALPVPYPPRPLKTGETPVPPGSKTGETPVPPGGKTSETPVLPGSKTGETPVPPTGSSADSQTPPLSHPARPPAEIQLRPALTLSPSVPVQNTPSPSAPVQKEGSQPRELPPGVWEPPPVRRGMESPEHAAPFVQETAAEHLQTELEDEGQPRLSKRHARFGIIGLVFFVVAVLGIAGIWGWQKILRSEETLSQEARELYGQGSYSAAEKTFRLLTQKFPTSDHAEEYHFLADWSAVCSTLSDPDLDPAVAVVQLEQFVKDHKKDQFIVQYARDAGLHLLKLAKTLAERTVNPSNEEPLQAVQRLEQLQQTLKALRADALTKDEFAQMEANLSKVRQAVALASKRRSVLAQLRPQGKELPMEAIKRARALLARMERELPGISQDAEAKAALARLEERHLASVVYHPATDVPPSPPQPPEEDADTLLFAPLLQTSQPTTAPANDPIVLALARGVLYALKQSNGDPKWIIHVGIDTSVLPQRVPASALNPELFLVLSADTQTLSALDGEKNSLWEYPIGQPVLGRPIILDHRAYLADYSGWVHEIELSRGQLLGRWFLGQPLTCGGAYEEGSSRLYFPADDSCIYVLDVKTHRCVAILYDGHPSGSLRSEPILIPPDGNAPGYLILNQTAGLDAMQLRVFELPLQDSHAAPLPLNPPARLAGWTWFKPKQDGEKLAVLSDAGILGLFGIKQLGNNDPPLFPWLGAGGLDLSPFLHQPAAPAKGGELARERGRAQVVHMQNEDLWVLAHGRLQRVYLHWNHWTGPEAVPRWETPLKLGSPLHDPQRLDRNGHSTFFLVTQGLEQPICLCTAVDEEGRILWQRQLGMVCQGEPLALTPPAGGPPLLVALDQGGGLFVLDPQQPLDKLRSTRRSLAPALEEDPLVPPQLLPAADGHSAYEIAALRDGQGLIVRHIGWTGARELRVQERKVPLLALPALGRNEMLTLLGSPAVTDSQLLIPLSDGNIWGLPWDADELLQGPGWRDNRTAVIAPCYVLALGGDRFLSTNGNNGLSVWEWPPGKESSWQLLPKESEPLKPLEYPIVAPPVLLPVEADHPSRVAVADASGVLRLFALKPDGSLHPERTWNLKGNLTAGPFVQAAPEGGWRIGCILDRRRLLWIDPTKAAPLWSYSTDGPAILGRPQLIEDMLVVALQSGRYVGIDPNTGRPKGPGYTLRTSAAPAAAPMPFGLGRMFVPLSDGTALLLSVELLKGTNHKRVNGNTEKKTK
jgi:outer membrane protein assembly factor BamB